MPLYLVKPKAGVRSAAISLAGRKMTLAARQKQSAEVIDLNRNDPAQQAIREWSAKSLKFGGLRAPLTGDVLGVHLVQMNGEDASRMAKEVGNVEVVPERELSLIRPHPVMEYVNNFQLQWKRRANDFSKACSGKGVTVAVLDTGVQADHPQFQDGRISGAYTFDLSTGEAALQTPSVDTDEGDGHGTHVAALICGRTFGFAPEAKVISGVMLPGGRGTTANFIIALAWVAQRPEIQIVNLSAGIPGYVPDMRDAVQSLQACGVLTVAAIGNDGRNTSRSPGNYVETLSVGSMEEGTDRPPHVSAFSGRSQVVIDQHLYRVPSVYAPGDAIESAMKDGTSGVMSGTSMAAPHISAMAACLFERSQGLDLLSLTEQIREFSGLRFFGHERRTHPEEFFMHFHRYFEDGYFGM